MENLPIVRMNFLRQSRKSFTYRTMIIALAAWCAFLMFLYGVQVLRYVDIKRKIENAMRTVSALNVEKDQHLEMIQQMSKRRVGLSAKHGLAAILQNRPIWSKVLSNLTDNLPPQVWLDSVRVLSEKEGDYELEVVGKAKSQRSLTNFIMQIESSGAFSDTSLVSTKLEDEQERRLNFEIKTRPRVTGF